MSKGSVIFVSLKNLTIIYARLSYHREKILVVEALKRNKNDLKCSYILSLCVEGFVKLIFFKDGKPEC
jgi:hypothetical protein